MQFVFIERMNNRQGKLVNTETGARQRDPRQAGRHPPVNTHGRQVLEIRLLPFGDTGGLPGQVLGLANHTRILYIRTDLKKFCCYFSTSTGNLEMIHVTATIISASP